MVVATQNTPTTSAHWVTTEALSDWTPYTFAANWSNTTYYGSFRRVGCNIELKNTMYLSGVVGGTWQATSAQMLNGLNLTIDSSKFPNYGTSSANQYSHNVGIWYGLQPGQYNFGGHMYFFSAPSSITFYMAIPAATNSWWDNITSSIPYSWNNEAQFEMNITLPILEWAMF